MGIIVFIYDMLVYLNVILFHIWLSDQKALISPLSSDALIYLPPVISAISS